MGHNDGGEHFRHKKRGSRYSGQSLLAAQLSTQVPIDMCDQPKPTVPKSTWAIVDVASWAYRIRQQLQKNATNSQLVKILNELEQQAKSQLICLNGYDQRLDKKPPRYKLAFNCFLCFWNFFIAFRFAFLAYLKDNRLRGFLGDCFIGFDGQEILNMLTCIGFFVFACVKLALVIQESVETMACLPLFAKFRDVKFKGSKLDLDPENEGSLRRLVVFMGYFVSVATLASWIPILSVHLFSMSINPFFSYSLLTYQVLWLPIVHIPVYFSIKATWWFFFHLVVSIFYASRVFKSLRTFGQRVKRKPDSTTPKELIAYYTCQHKLFNIIDKVNNDFSYCLFASVIFGSCMADFIFFCATYLGTGSIYLSTILALLAVAYISAVLSFNLFAAAAYKQISLCTFNNYRLATIFPNNLQLHMKAESIFERLSVRKMAIYVGRIFPVDEFHFSIFFAENCSLYMLLVTNIAARVGTSKGSEGS